MNLNRERWFVRWFFWSLGIYDAFNQKDMSYNVEQRGTNLCFFMRVTLVYAPLILLLHLALVGLAAAVLTAFPIYVFGFQLYLWGWGTLISIVLACMIGTAAAHYTKEYRNHRARLRNLTRYVEEIEHGAQEHRGATASDVVFEYIKAQKMKICPTITFIRQTRKEVRQ